MAKRSRKMSPGAKQGSRKSGPSASRGRSGKSGPHRGPASKDRERREDVSKGKPGGRIRTIRGLGTKPEDRAAARDLKPGKGVIKLSEKNKPKKSVKAGAPKAPASEVVTVGFVSLGCPKNLVDSEKMLGLLALDGIIPVATGGQAERWDDSAHTEGGTIHEDQHSHPHDNEHGDLDAAPTGTRAEGCASYGGASTLPDADAIVVNTCGFLEASKEESLTVIRDAVKAKQEGRVKRVVVAGCLVQRHRAKMLEWEPGIDAMIGVFDRDKIVEAVRGKAPERKGLKESSDGPAYWISGNALVAARERGMKTAGLTVNGKDGTGVGYFEDDATRLRLTPRHYAYLRISEGCNQACAFCTIPSIRGKMRSKPIDRIAAETAELLNDGAFELNLIGQDTTSYGDDIGLGLDAEITIEGTPVGGGLAALLRVIDDVAEETLGPVKNGSPNAWIRLMYAYPSNFSDPIIEAIAELVAKGRMLPYIDMPLQHASDNMLTSMRRNVSAAHQRELIHKLRERIPGMAIRTTFISGFPGETERDHEELLAFVRDMRFDAVGVFEYSREPGTPAGTMDEDPKLAVDAATKTRRKGEVMAAQQEVAFAKASAIAGEFDESRPGQTGRRVDVLIDGATQSAGIKTSGVGAGGRLYQGRTYFQAPQIDAITYVQSRERLSPGELVRCAIVAADGYDLIARPVAELEKRTSLKIL
ncbi:MAG: 30S ribosomal protein S12 methylthiotransferase RimO [Phycisphaeraceae bacterium]|nr:MAG: 30S ribosomal protein S12 methylthiotransferase RimO [Phycisphaeraceae bacterium]